MRTVFTTIMLTAVLAVASGAYAAAAQTATAKKSAAPVSAAKPAAASHSVKGVVKSIDASSLVITKSGKAGGDMTFTLNADTKRDGAPAVGSPVSVRYRSEGGAMVATAVTAQPAKAVKTQAKK
jgi:uncharacterized protein DUF5666